MRVLVCGDRNWANSLVIGCELRLLAMSSELTLIHGDCRGADRIADEWARHHAFERLVFPADWKAHGRAAGPIRNAQMLREGEPDLVLAFHADIEHSRGTKDMVSRARQAGIPVKVIER